MLKKILIIGLFLTFSYSKSTYYVDQVSQFKILSNHSKSIMMIGDSITDRGLWNELLNRNDIINRGINGDTTTGLLKRIDVNSIDLKKVFIMIGINDLFKKKSVNFVYTNYIEIISYFRSNGIIPIIQSTLYINRDADTEINLKVKKLNGLLEEYCEKELLTYIDINKILSPNGYLDSAYSNDRIHLNGKGYRLWADKIVKFMD